MWKKITRIDDAMDSVSNSSESEFVVADEDKPESVISDVSFESVVPEKPPEEIPCTISTPQFNFSKYSAAKLLS